MFARYAYPPNALGYCGPAGAEAMLRGDATADIARRARRFEGAWSYLEFLASSAGIADPLDERVVEAYWVGDDLLAGVSSAALVSFLTTRFAGQSGGTWQDAADRALAPPQLPRLRGLPVGRAARPHRPAAGALGARPVPDPHRRGDAR